MKKVKAKSKKVEKKPREIMIRKVYLKDVEEMNAATILVNRMNESMFDIFPDLIVFREVMNAKKPKKVAAQ